MQGGAVILCEIVPRRDGIHKNPSRTADHRNGLCTLAEYLAERLGPGCPDAHRDRPKFVALGGARVSPKTLLGHSDFGLGVRLDYLSGTRGLARPARPPPAGPPASFHRY